MNQDESGSLTDWHRWVPPAVRRDVISFMARAFVIGMVLGGAAGAFYWKYSVSKEKIFQGAIIVAALAFTMPAFATSLKLMLSMFYMSWAGQEKADGVWRNLKEIKDEVKPVIENVGKIMDNLARVVERYGKNDIVKSLVEEAKTVLAKEGGIIQKVDRLTLAIEALGVTAPAPRKSGLLERGIQPRTAPEIAQLDEDVRVLHAGHAT